MTTIVIYQYDGVGTVDQLDHKEFIHYKVKGWKEKKIKNKK